MQRRVVGLLGGLVVVAEREVDHVEDAVGDGAGVAFAARCRSSRRPSAVTMSSSRAAPSEAMIGTSRITASGQRCRMMPEMKVPWPQSTSTRPLTSSMITPVFSGSRDGSFHTPIGSPSKVTRRCAPGQVPVHCSAVAPSGSSGNHGCFPRPVSRTATTGAFALGVTDVRGARWPIILPGCGRRCRGCRTRRAGRHRPTRRRLRPRRRLRHPTRRRLRPRRHLRHPTRRRRR